MGGPLFPPLLRPSHLARFWELHPKTVYLWIREGRLAAVRTPGDQYRLRAADVRAFCEAKGLPVPPLAMGDARRVHAAAKVGPALRALRRTLKQADAPLDVFDHAIEALFATVASPPSMLVLDAACPGVHLASALRALRRRPDLEALPVVVYGAPTAAQADALVRAGATHASRSGRDRDAWSEITRLLS